MNVHEQRLEAMKRRISGEPVAKICLNLGKSRVWFYKWWSRYQELGPEGLIDYSRKAHTPVGKTDIKMENAIVNLRKLKEKRDQEKTKYALIGAPSIAQELKELGFKDIPSTSTINNILNRHNLLNPMIPKEKDSWNKRDYPVPSAQYPNDVHQMDFVGPWYLKEDSTKYYFAVLKDVASLSVSIEAIDKKNSKIAFDFIISSFQSLGIPIILQVDNALEFRGSNRYPRSFGCFIRLCLLLGVEVLFIPPKSPWRNGNVENFNGLLEKLLMNTQKFTEFAQVKAEIPAFLEFCNERHVHKPLKYLTSKEFREQHQDHIRLLDKFFYQPKKKKLPISDGKVSFIRRIGKNGQVGILTEKFDIDKDLAHEYVYATIFTADEVLQVFHNKEQIKEFEFKLPK